MISTTDYRDKNLNELLKEAATLKAGEERFLVLSAIWAKFRENSSLSFSFQRVRQYQPLEISEEMRLLYSKVWNIHKPLDSPLVQSADLRLQNHKKLFFFLYRIYENFKGRFIENPSLKILLEEFFWSLGSFEDVEIVSKMFSRDSFQIEDLPSFIRLNAFLQKASDLMALEIVVEIFKILEKVEASPSLFARFLSKQSPEKQVALLEKFSKNGLSSYIYRSLFLVDSDCFQAFKLFFSQHSSVSYMIDEIDDLPTLRALVYIAVKNHSLPLQVFSPKSEEERRALLKAICLCINADANSLFFSNHVLVVGFFEALSQDSIYKNALFITLLREVLEGLALQEQNSLLSFCKEGELLQGVYKVLSEERNCLKHALAVFFASQFGLSEDLLIDMSSAELRCFVCIKEKKHRLLNFTNQEPLLGALVRFSPTDVFDFFKQACNPSRDAVLFARYLERFSEAEIGEFLRKEFCGYAKELVRIEYFSLFISLRAFFTRETSPVFQTASSFFVIKSLLHFLDHPILKPEDVNEESTGEFTEALQKVWEVEGGKEKVRTFFQANKWGNRSFLCIRFLENLPLEEQKEFLSSKVLSSYIPTVLRYGNLLSIDCLGFLVERMQSKYRSFNFKQVTSLPQLSAMFYILEPAQYLPPSNQDLEIALNLIYPTNPSLVVNVFLGASAKEEYFPIFEVFLPKIEELQKRLFTKEFKKYLDYLKEIGSVKNFILIKELLLADLRKSFRATSLSSCFEKIEDYNDLHIIENVLKKNQKGILDSFADRKAFAKVVKKLYLEGFKSELFFVLEVLFKEDGFSELLDVFSENYLELFLQSSLKEKCYLTEMPLVKEKIYFSMKTKFPEILESEWLSVFAKIETFSEIEVVDALFRVCRGDLSLEGNTHLREFLRLGNKFELKRQILQLFWLLKNEEDASMAFYQFCYFLKPKEQKEFLSSLLKVPGNQRYLMYLSSSESKNFPEMFLFGVELKLEKDFPLFSKVIVRELLFLLSNPVHPPLREFMGLTSLDLYILAPLLPNKTRTYELLASLFDEEEYAEYRIGMLSLDDLLREDFLKWVIASKNSVLLHKVSAFILEEMKESNPSRNFKELFSHEETIDLSFVENFNNILNWQREHFPTYANLEKALFRAWQFGLKERVISVFSYLKPENLCLVFKNFLILFEDSFSSILQNPMTEENINEYIELSLSGWTFLREYFEGKSFKDIESIKTSLNLEWSSLFFTKTKKEIAFRLDKDGPRDLASFDLIETQEFINWLTQKSSDSSLSKIIQGIGASLEAAELNVSISTYKRKIYLAKTIILAFLEKERKISLKKPVSFFKLEALLKDENPLQFVDEVKTFVRFLFDFNLELAPTAEGEKFKNWSKDLQDACNQVPEDLPRTFVNGVAGILISAVQNLVVVDSSQKASIKFVYEEEDSVLENIFSMHSYYLLSNKDINLHAGSKKLLDCFLNPSNKVYPMVDLREDEIQKNLQNYIDELEGFIFIEAFEESNTYQKYCSFKRQFHCLCLQAKNKINRMDLVAFKQGIGHIYDFILVKELRIILNEILYEQYVLTLESCRAFPGKEKLITLKERIQGLAGNVPEKNRLTKTHLCSILPCEERDYLIQVLEDPFIEI